MASRGPRFLVDWRVRFDALLVLDPPQGPPPSGLAERYRGDYVALYRIVPQDGHEAGPQAGR
jgi:hypothetical protein